MQTESNNVTERSFTITMLASSQDRKIYPKVHLETQKTMNSQGNTEQKRATLEVSEYPTSNYTTEP
jgi:hypothetical protein